MYSFTKKTSFLLSPRVKPRKKFMLNVRDTSRFYQKNVGFSVLSYLNISLLKIGIFWKWDLECSARHKTCPTNSSRGSSPGTLGTRLCVLLWWNQYLLLLTANVAHDPRFSSKKKHGSKVIQIEMSFEISAGTPYTKTTEKYIYRTIDRTLFFVLIGFASVGIAYALLCLLVLALNFKKK